MVCGALLGVMALCVTAAAPSPVELDVYGLRPYQLLGLDERDSADANGEVFFLLGDRIAQRQVCNQNPEAFFCKCEVTCEDNVYTKYRLAAQYGVDYDYAICNPVGNTTSDPEYKCIKGDKFYPGSAAVADRYPTPASACAAPGTQGTKACYWKYDTSKQVGGYWYSTPAAGNCDTHPEKCSWRITATVKVVNQSCVDDSLISLVTSTNETCFSGCPAPGNTSSTCYLDCFFATVANIPTPTLISRFNQAFDSEDPSQGGCPSRPPYQPPRK